MISLLLFGTAAGLASLGSLLAQTGTGGGAIDTVAPWINSGGTAAAVAALGWSLRQMVVGNVVSRPVAELQTETTKLVYASFKREEDFAGVLHDGHEREKAAAVMIDRQSEALGRALSIIEKAGG